MKQKQRNAKEDGVEGFMEQRGEVRGCHILEKDLIGDLIWTWTYPKLDETARSVYFKKCAFLLPGSRSQHFYFFRYSNLWVYVYFSEVLSSDKLPHAQIVALMLSTLDFNPARYETLCRILSKSYCKSGSPVHMLQLFLSVVSYAKCTTEENETFYWAEFNPPSPLYNSQVAEIIGRFGLDAILIYTALLLKRRIIVYHHEVSDLVKFVMSLPAFIPHRDMWHTIYPWVEMHADELLPFQESKLHILGCTNSSIENEIDMYDLYINIPACEITIAPHAKESMNMTKTHKDIAIFMVQLTQKKGFSESDIIHSISQKTKELIRNARTVGSVDDDNEKSIITVDQLQKNDFTNPLETFLLSLARAEGLFVI